MDKKNRAVRLLCLEGCGGPSTEKISMCWVSGGLVSATSLSSNNISQTVRPAMALAGLKISPVWGEESACGAWQKLFVLSS